MNDVDSARARAEALDEPGGRALRSARRSQMWAGLNRYLASEAAHARRTEDSEVVDGGNTGGAAKKDAQQANPPRARDRE